MKQVFQSLSNGEVELINLPSPSGTEDQILIQTICSLVSKGTEKMLIEFGKKNLISKVKSQPAKSKELINKAFNEGPLIAIEAAKSKLDKPLALGYCNVGKVLSVGKPRSWAGLMKVAPSEIG